MNLFSFITSAVRPDSSRRSVALLVVGVTVGVAIGGVGVSRASTSQAVTFCVNKKTQVVRLPKTGRCARTETRLPMNSTGVAGATGVAGSVGPAGPPGPSGPAGAVGPGGVAGATGPAGPAGPQGSQGAPGAQGAAGTDGTSGNQWTEYGSLSTDVLSTQSQRQIAYDFGLQEADDEQFTVYSWVESSTTPTHVITYKANAGERVTTTAYPLGGGGTSVATWLVYSATAGVQDIGTARTVSTRWIIEVRTGNPEMTRTYEIIIEMGPLQNGRSSLFASFSKRT